MDTLPFIIYCFIGHLSYDASQPDFPPMKLAYFATGFSDWSDIDEKNQMDSSLNTFTSSLLIGLSFLMALVKGT